MARSRFGVIRTRVMPLKRNGPQREVWARSRLRAIYSNAKMRFQSFFMLITVQPSFFASS